MRSLWLLRGLAIGRVQFFAALVTCCSARYAVDSIRLTAKGFDQKKAVESMPWPLDAVLGLCVVRCKSSCAPASWDSLCRIGLAVRSSAALNIYSCPSDEEQASVRSFLRPNDPDKQGSGMQVGHSVCLAAMSWARAVSCIWQCRKASRSQSTPIQSFQTSVKLMPRRLLSLSSTATTAVSPSVRILCKPSLRTSSNHANGR